MSDRSLDQGDPSVVRHSPFDTIHLCDPLTGECLGTTPEIFSYDAPDPSLPSVDDLVWDETTPAMQEAAQIRAALHYDDSARPPLSAPVIDARRAAVAQRILDVLGPHADWSDDLRAIIAIYAKPPVILPRSSRRRP